jgi:predicted RecA/RadA family phage recombinase
MAVLAADINVNYRGNPTKFDFLCTAADIYYAGALVFIIKGTGKVQPLAAANYNFAGICCKQVTTTAAGQAVECFIDGIFEVPLGANIAAADEGDILLMDASGTLSDNPADLVANLDVTGVVTDVCVARLLQAKTATMWIQLEHRICVTNVGWV